MSNVINRKPEFEIVESQHRSTLAYTHKLYLHGKLFTDELYRKKDGEWWYDDGKTPDIKIFSALHAYELPDTLWFHFFSEHIGGNYPFDRARRIGNKLVFEFRFSI